MSLSKASMANSIATSLSLKKRDVTKVIRALADLGSKEMKSVGKFVVPGLCMIKTKKKPATKWDMKKMFGKEVYVAAKPAKTVLKAFCSAKIKKAVGGTVDLSDAVADMLSFPFFVPAATPPGDDLVDSPLLFTPPHVPRTPLEAVPLW